ncbi:MAG TPA: RHS repeat-associated core domain-containing protein, partial [Sedimentisphaerales bacterium]|nr:RHS repeat-associated core domain-containing protein [Sedimentisphaerales bacterium]HRS12984.1 RHS repeat-associated core domain-containing protein [Sedimentisphaerales bacterium]HRV49594.1 RHS repeat-associated core domain-containing protein [Sedimentisphaerales bacterium]
PTIGRFLQTDPIGYADGMNWYAYCGNNPMCRSDPTGLWYHFTASDDGEGMKLVWETYTGEYREIGVWADIDEFIDEAYLGRIAEFGSGWERNELGWKLTEATSKFDRERKWWFWRLKALEFLDGSMASMYQTMENAKEKDGKTPFTVVFTRSYRNWYTPGTNLVEWRWTVDSVYLENEGCNANWNQCNALALLAHELTHAYADAAGCPFGEEDQQTREGEAVRTENCIRCSLFKLDPTEQETWPRPGYQPWVGDVAGATNAEQAWAKFNWEFIWKPIP